MRNMGIHVVGTIRTNKAGLPKKGIFTVKKGIRNATPRGSSLCHKRIKDDVWLVGWYDNREVHLLSSIQPYNGVVTRKIKAHTEGSGRNERHVEFEKKEIQRPSTVEIYKASMCGTDLCGTDLA